jgi:hypothetical protein
VIGPRLRKVSPSPPPPSRGSKRSSAGDNKRASNSVKRVASGDRRTPTGRRTRRFGSYRRLVDVGDMALGLGLAATRPARELTSQAVHTAERVSAAFGQAFIDSLPEEQRDALYDQADDLTHAGRQARIDTVDALVSIVVAEVLSSDLVRSAMVSATSQALDEVVDAAMPTVVDQLRSEIATVRLDEMVRASVDRVVPEVIERDLSNAIAAAVGIPGRTARGLARLPSSVLRASLVDEGYDE